MTISRLAILKGAGWIFLSYVASLAFRFASNIVLARILAPDIFGAMVIISTMKIGVELTSDLGIGQNIIYSAKSQDPDFYNTAWTLQLLRGVFLFVVCFLISAPLAEFYGIPIGAAQAASLAFLFAGASSLSLSLMLRSMSLAQRNLYDAALDFVTLVIQVAFCYWSPTLWSLIIAGLIGGFIRSVTSYWLPSPRHRLLLKPAHAWEIVHFGKWIFVSSVVLFASSYTDRLYLGSIAWLAVLGIYSIARSISELPTALATRLSQFIVFPVTSTTELPRTVLRSKAAPLRMASLLMAAVVLALGAGLADVLIGTVYDERYREAGWMLTVLLLGAWGAVLCSFNEASLLGFGKPQYAALANTAKLACLIVGLPVSFLHFGMLGAVCVIALSDAFRYFPILLGQARERFTFATQDLIATLMLVVVFLGFLAARQASGWGGPFDGLHVGPA